MSLKKASRSAANNQDINIGRTCCHSVDWSYRFTEKPCGYGVDNVETMNNSISPKLYRLDRRPVTCLASLECFQSQELDDPMLEDKIEVLG